MLQSSATAPTREPRWERAFSMPELEQAGARTVKLDGKQIAVFLRDGQVYACNNRCPHEGFPLKAGTLSETCTLTCNWHNWKFDLTTGDNLYGGDRLRIYPVEIRDGDIWIDVSDEDSATLIEEALANLRDSFDRHEYDRMARELARMEKAGGDPLDALRRTIHWTHDRFEFGMGSTHAHIAAPDWLSLGNCAGIDPAKRLMPIHETIAYLAWDSRREPAFPYCERIEPWDDETFADAMETEDEDTAIALVRGAMKDGKTWNDLEPAFARAALRHYLDFGHGAIYVVKTGELLDHLGDEVMEPLLLALTRGLIMASREDLIPEFRDYAQCLEAWGRETDITPGIADFESLGADRAMELAARSALPPQELFDVLFEMSCRSLLRYDHVACQKQNDEPISHNRGWLNFTHEITFANAARRLAARYPELWPNALLQICCFFGRNTQFLDRSVTVEDWLPDNPGGFIDDTLESLFDHGQFEYIVAAHLVKTVSAAAEEIRHAPDAPWKPVLLAALNRFLNAPLKRRNPIRTVTQARAFVHIED